MTDAPTGIDGISAAPAPAAPAPAATPLDAADTASVRRWKKIVLVFGSGLYALYLLWALILFVILPSTDATISMLVPVGVVSALVAAGAMIIVGGGVLMHIAQSKYSSSKKQWALLKVILALAPGLAMSVVLPLRIMGEPALIIDIVQPANAATLIAPVSVTFDASRAAAVQARSTGSPVQYKWDLNGDRIADRETLEPQLTAMFEREGIYTISVSMVTAAGNARTASRRMVISQSVFSVNPTTPVRELPATFSIAHLVSSPQEVLTVQWDFDGDGVADEISEGVEASYTYYETGSYLVTATVELQNLTQAQYRRPVDVVEPQPLPFPVRIVSEPVNLIGTPPFSALFSLETDEELTAVQWTFGDGERGEGERVTHTFDRKGNYSVQARVRSTSGSVADVATLVKVVDRLTISDLVFEGSPRVVAGTVKGEVPLTLSLRPTTSLPFIDFVWEAPGATEVGSTQNQLQAIYRREGTYTVTLIARDSEDRVLRYPITVEVQPPSSELSISMNPTSGVAPLNVLFDASESSIPGQEITGFIWSFGDGSARVYGGARSEHTFAKAGSYVIEVTIRTTSGEEFKTNKTLVVREPLLQACILPTRTQGSAPLGVEFRSDCSAGVFASSLWDFGDGSQSDVPNPVHVFDSAGVYDVTLRITDQTGAKSTATVTITVY